MIYIKKCFDTHSVFLFILFIMLLFFLGCCRLVVTSQPEGAAIYYSTGVGQQIEWKPWPPSNKPRKPATTPETRYTFLRNNYFVRVDLPGYYQPEPQLVEMLPLKNFKVAFLLEETPETFAHKQMEKGLVLYKGEWVNPQEKDLIFENGQWFSREEKFVLEQRRRGLILYKGAWMTPLEKETLIMEEYRQKGFVQYKGEWMEREQFEKEQRIDRTVAELVETSGTQQMESPKVVGIIRGERSKIRLFNGTGNAATFYLSGAESQSIKIEGYDSTVILIPPGEYTILVNEIQYDELQKPIGSLREYVSATLESGFQYSLSYEGHPLSLPIKTKDVDQYIKETFEIPSIEVPIDENEIKNLRRPRRPPGESKEQSPQRRNNAR